MSSYSMSEIKNFSRDSIKKIIPLDDESIDEMVQYAIRSNKTREAICNHFLDILGPTDDTFQFISKFGDMLFGSQQPVQKLSSSLSPSPSSSSSSPSPKIGTSKPKPKITVKAANKNSKSLSGIRLVKTVKNENTSNGNSKGRMSNNSKNGSTTSEMFNMKPTTIEADKVKRKEVKKKLDNIQDLDDVLLELELMDSQENSKDIRICNCNATRHPLFEMYPNCLNCGKIICAKEGLQPCSFCGKPLMSNDERLELKHILNKEKIELEGKNEKQKENTINNKNKKKNVIRVTLNTPGQNNFKIQEQLYNQIEQSRKQEREETKAKKEEQDEIDRNRKEIEYYNSMHKKDPELIKAEERLAMLLSFQDNGAERTKIIDNAADFELPTGNGSLWASPMERALQMKRQQKQQKKMKDDEQNRSGRGNTVVEMTIKDGKAVFQDKNTESGLFDNLSDDEEISELQKKVNNEKLKQFKLDAQNVYDFDSFNNKLHKPVYHGKPSEEAKEEEKSTVVDKMISDLPKLGTVVQLGDAEEQEDQLFSMIGV